MQGSMRNENPETTASPSHDSLACILLETTLRYKMDRRGLHGPRPRNIGHVVFLSFKILKVYVLQLLDPMTVVFRN